MTTAKNEILFIDANVLDKESLIAELSSNIHVVVLDDKTPVINQIATVLEGYQNLDAIHIVSHGAEGELVFANGIINNANVSDYATQLKRIGSALSVNGDLLLYGCNVAKGDDGLTFINTLANLTDADVAASDDLTGSRGDWVLESTSGNIEAAQLKINNQNILTLGVDNLPSIYIRSTSVFEGDFGMKQAIIFIQVGGGGSVNDVISVDYSIENYSGPYDANTDWASSGSDFIPSSGTIKFYLNNAENIIPFSIVGDTKVEKNEKFAIKLSNPINAYLSPGNTSTVTIINDDSTRTPDLQIYKPGQAVIDLGTKGKLINPVQVDGVSLNKRSQSSTRF